MKKLICMLLALTILLAACGTAQSEQSFDAEPPSAAETTPAVSDSSSAESIPAVLETPSAEPATNDEIQQSHILVAYFSRSGNTVWEDDVDAVASASINVQADGTFVGNAELLAQMAQLISGGDLFLIKTVETYPSDYREATDQAKVEQNNDARPALASHVENMDGYDTVILIYPNWWGTLPQPVMTFLDEYDFSGKTILPLCTHGGSRLGSSERKIAELCPGIQLLSGLEVRNSDAANAQADVRTWIVNSGILE